mmetsp:Transcript_10713/g.14882  ORF Transcript_10713/g.14882 Transcript_10713/m.14882 type:complete len:498 (-) Transcript_10713:367-1860(-)|eukprot:CAMPEP_0184478516 /NCGR_PEP_ID=MMETSP0113_2-20130426/521_1 /TAXON_ID=91329 /ORGANISM="Norrisiella sphaerica, Strain BC52" /LENGTH=497 /DNA_ID=CAMNT_0026856339 /DNA_START=34 /DNA_END=1527 /DNA_ORIENTATION=-
MLTRRLRFASPFRVGRQARVLSTNVSNSRRPLSAYAESVEERSLASLLKNEDVAEPSEMQEDMASVRKKFSGFFRRPPVERKDLLAEVFPGVDMEPLTTGLPMEIADLMIENAVGGVTLPLGVAPNFVINGSHYIVPMAVEEPSVIAAASSIAKLVSENGGFKAKSTENIMTSQVQLLEVNADDACKIISENRAELIAAANQFCQSSVKRGGGVRDIYPRFIMPRLDPSRDPYVVVHIDVDVCEAMGANIVNTVAEGIAPRLADLVGGRPALRILSNLCLKRRSGAAFRLPFDSLSWKGVKGETVAERVIEAYMFAEDDPYRAATHNKGVMNGIDSAAIAMGQDWRAIEASCHAAAAMGGSYGSMTKYSIDNGYLVGKLEMPMSCGSKGGALTTHPLYKLTHKLLGYPNAQTICQILVAVGLAQNFAAIRALAIEGIQKGHMNLHARNICLNAGVPNELVDECREFMTLQKKWDTATAEEFMAKRGITPAGSTAVSS